MVTICVIIFSGDISEFDFGENERELLEIIMPKRMPKREEGSKKEEKDKNEEKEKEKKKGDKKEEKPIKSKRTLTLQGQFFKPVLMTIMTNIKT